MRVFVRRQGLAAAENFFLFTAIGFLGVVAGAAMTQLEIGLYRFLRDPLIAAEALLYADKRNDDISYSMTGVKNPSVFDSANPPVITDHVGVARSDAALAYAGYTLYATKSGGPGIALVDMEGRQVHEWTVPLTELGEVSAKMSRLSIRQISAIPNVYPNGDMLMVVTAKGATPWGMGLAKVDKDSKLLWFLDHPVHHDSDIGPDGTIYTLGHFVDNKIRKGAERLQTPFIDDTIMVVSATGELLQEFSLLDAISQSEYENILIYADPVSFNGDVLHANSVQYLSADQLRKLPGVPEGSLIISIRNLNTVVIVDPATEKVVWASSGGWHLQHDAQLLGNGNMLLFDNMGDISAGAMGSQVIELDPVTHERVWVFPGESSESLYSAVRSSQQRLPNGNTLITESSNGRVVEVTPENQVAWEFFVPERVKRKNGVFAKVVKSLRFAPEYFEPELRNKFAH